MWYEIDAVMQSLNHHCSGRWQ